MKIAHFSDTHLGYTSYQVRSKDSGINQREEDFARSFFNTIDSIIATNPDVVLMTGDLLHAPMVPVRSLLVAKKGLTKLTMRADGTPRPVIVIAGNHDAPRDLRDGVFLDLLRGIPHLFPVARGCSRIPLTDYPGLENVCVHGLPHDSLDVLDELGDISPDPDFAVNILMAHGVAEASDLYTRAIGRESSIPLDLMAKPWNYVALGHFHKQGPVNLTGREENLNSRVWYAGSTDINGFGDASQEGVHNQRGWLLVNLGPDEFEVERRAVTVRAVINLPVVDCTELTPDQVADQLNANVKACVARSGAVVRQKVLNITSDMWALVNTYQARDLAKDTMFYKFDVRYTKPDLDDEETTVIQGMAGVGAVLEEVVEDLIPEPDRSAVTDLVLHMLGESLSTAEQPDFVEDEDLPATRETPLPVPAASAPAVEPSPPAAAVGDDEPEASEFSEPQDPAAAFAAMDQMFGAAS